MGMLLQNYQIFNKNFHTVHVDFWYSIFWCFDY